ncbi:hypothetical protein R1T16_10560 [Flavobacterium sp. DG1-102-2]|nr:hypothetical protein [Flavobacterium sp. DG1-102-2]MDV6168868.1 hypothetical protein [Flavobacterium sp. DG1-102-2]
MFTNSLGYPENGKWQEPEITANKKTNRLRLKVYPERNLKSSV